MEAGVIEAIERLTEAVNRLTAMMEPKCASAEDVLIAAQVAEILKVDASTVAYYKKSGRLRTVRIGGKDYFFKSEVLSLARIPKRGSNPLAD